MATKSTPRGPERPPDQMPKPALRRRAVGAAGWVEHRLTLCTISPVFGGGSRPREVDAHEPVRGASVRGHLRFWWRATQGHRFDDERALAEAEKAVFGGVGGDDVSRSALELRVANARGVAARVTHGELGDGARYALWVAARNKQQDAAQMVAPGLTFDLHLTLPAALEDEALDAVRAWVRFGGYGGRTRRGAGSLTVVGANAAEWLPASTDRRALLGAVADLRPTFATDMPILAGAGLAVGAPMLAERAFETAAGWLKDFRQGGGGQRGAAHATAAREPGDGPRDRRLGPSRWPEADKVRRLSGGRTDHPPRYGSEPAWPRAGFGLPIIGQFQRTARKGGTLREPGDFELRWRERRADGRPGPARDRLASPLIVKPLALADGRCVPLALWLHRAFPDGEVILHGHPRADASAAPFDRLLGDGDVALFAPLAAGTRAGAGRALRTAFFSWLEETRKAREVAR